MAEIESKPWTIKGIPDPTRNAATVAAENSGMKIGAWVTAAIHEKIQADRGRSTDLVPVAPQLPAVLNADGAAAGLPAAEAGAFDTLALIERAAGVAKDVAAIGESGSSLQKLLFSRLRTTVQGATGTRKAGRTADTESD